MQTEGFESTLRTVRRGLGGLALAGVLSLGLAGAAAAQDIAASGNGGTADAAANGGAVAIGDVNSGGNTGGAISVGDVGAAPELVCDKYGDCYEVGGSDAAVAIDGGDVTSDLTLDISADAGVAIADASGGDANFAFVQLVP